MEFSGTQSVYLQGPTRFQFGQTSSVWQDDHIPMEIELTVKVGL